MAKPPSDYPLDQDPGELHMLLSISARLLVDSPDPKPFLDWIADAGPTLAPGIAAHVHPAAGAPGLIFRTIGVAIFNAMPQPAAAYRPLTLATPGRNDPCVCGSGAKYRHCCLPLAGGLDFSRFNLLRYVLDYVAQKQFGELPKSQVDPLAVCDTAAQWQHEGSENRAIKLLEPWFADSVVLSEALEPLFDQLMDCYLALGKVRKRERLVEQVIARGDNRLRAAALQRRSMMLADDGKLADAWDVFLQAQRMDPDNAALVTLELTLLMSQGDIERARERAQFWLLRLERMRDPELARLIDFVRAVRDDPLVAMSELASEQIPGLDVLDDLLRRAPPVAAHYSVQNKGERILHASASMRRLERRWREVFPQLKPALTATQNFEDIMWDDPAAWLDVLADNSLAWQCFDVLDDLVLAVDSLQLAASTLVERLLERGVQLLEANLDRTSKSRGVLPWICVENRPALRLLAHAAYRVLDEPDRVEGNDDFVARAEMLMMLNPNDNHGMRDPLSLVYLSRGWPDKVVALTDSYPDDFCGPALNRVLALFALGHKTEAESALLTAFERHGIALKMLAARNPRAPKREPGHGIKVGGRQEAWMYRSAALSLWQRYGALDWLRKARKNYPKS